MPTDSGSEAAVEGLAGDTLVESLHGSPAETLDQTAELEPSSGVRRRTRPARDEAVDRRSDPLSRLGTCIGGRFQIEDVLGTGGMGAVYRARDLLTGQDVAIKVLKAELAESAEAIHRFLREARTAGALAHPNIVSIRDAGIETQTGLLYLVMELLDGKTAADLLEQRGAFPVDDVLEIARGVLQGLRAAHEKGIIHRDLKPANVFLTRKGGGERVRLIDFGIAKAAPRSQTSLKLTTPGIVLGTPHYLSPEQARGQTDLDVRVDIYALGVVMYELLTGRTPFDRPGYMQVLAAICREAPKDLCESVPGLEPEVAVIVRRAMSKNRDERFASAAEMLSAPEALGRPAPALGTETPAGAWATLASEAETSAVDLVAAVRDAAERSPATDPGKSTLPGFGTSEASRCERRGIHSPVASGGSGGAGGPPGEMPETDTSCEVAIPPAAPPAKARRLSRAAVWMVAAAATLLAAAATAAAIVSF